MNAAVSLASGEDRVLARDLLRRAVAAFADVDVDERGPALAALDGFLATPGPARYLAAVRVLEQARRAGALRQVRTAHAGYAFARGLQIVRRELGAATAEELASMPVDERTGLRLRALALLAAAHRELAERVAGSADFLRQQLALAQQKSLPAVPSRRRSMPARRRSAPPRRRAPT